MFTVTNMWYVVLYVVWFNVFSVIHSKFPKDVRNWTIGFNGTIVPKAESYLCKGFKVEENEYIVEFDIIANKSVVHHIFIFGCKTIAVEDEIYECAASPICKGAASVLYAWSVGEPFQIPKGVGIAIGKSSNINYVVLQIHYAERQQDSEDHSTVMLQTLPKNNSYIKYRGGVFTNEKEVHGGIIPKHQQMNMDTICHLPGTRSAIKIIAMRVHTHAIGYSVSLYLVRNNTWTLVGRLNPKKPQVFIPQKTELEVQPGDILASRCVMHNTRDVDVKMGLFKDNEMCLTHIMYTTDNLEEHVAMDGCISPTNLTWKDHLNIPDQVEHDIQEPGTK